MQALERVALPVSKHTDCESVGLFCTLPEQANGRFRLNQVIEGLEPDWEIYPPDSFGPLEAS